MVELIVVMAILAVIAAVVFPVFGQALSKAHETSGLSNVRQVYLAAQLYRQDHEKYPNLPDNLVSLTFAPYFGGKAPVCPADPNFGAGFSYHIDGSMAFLSNLSKDIDYRDAYQKRIECRDLRGPDLPIVTDRNHADKRVGYRTGAPFFLVARESGALVRIPKKRFDPVIAGFFSQKGRFPCHPYTMHLNL